MKPLTVLLACTPAAAFTLLYLAAAKLDARLGWHAVVVMVGALLGLWGFPVH